MAIQRLSVLFLFVAALVTNGCVINEDGCIETFVVGETCGDTDGDDGDDRPEELDGDQICEDLQNKKNLPGMEKYETRSIAPSTNAGTEIPKSTLVWRNEYPGDVRNMVWGWSGPLTSFYAWYWQGTPSIHEQPATLDTIHADISLNTTMPQPDPGIYEIAFNHRANPRFFEKWDHPSNWGEYNVVWMTVETAYSSSEAPPAAEFHYTESTIGPLDQAAPVMLQVNIETNKAWVLGAIVPPFYRGRWELLDKRFRVRGRAYSAHVDADATVYTVNANPAYEVPEWGDVPTLGVEHQNWSFFPTHGMCQLIEKEMPVGGGE